MRGRLGIEERGFPLAFAFYFLPSMLAESGTGSTWNRLNEKLLLVVKGAQMADFLASDWSRAGGTSGDVTSGVLGWETTDQWIK